MLCDLEKFCPHESLQIILFQMQKLHENFTKYHPAGYSSRYLASRKFASQIFGWNILLPIHKKITNYGQNDSYSTQCHTKGFQNIKLVSHYSKSVSRKNSKCLDFVLVQVTHVVKRKTQSLLHATQNQKMTSIQHNGIPRASKISN